MTEESTYTVKDPIIVKNNEIVFTISVCRPAYPLGQPATKDSRPADLGPTESGFGGGL